MWCWYHAQPAKWEGEDGEVMMIEEVGGRLHKGVGPHIFVCLCVCLWGPIMLQQTLAMERCMALCGRHLEGARLRHAPMHTHACVHFMHVLPQHRTLCTTAWYVCACVCVCLAGRSKTGADNGLSARSQQRCAICRASRQPPVKCLLAITRFS